MRVFAIDPGTRESAWCLVDAETKRPLLFDICGNKALRTVIKETRFGEEDHAAIEMLQSYGNLIGRDVLETAVWIGRFYECLTRKLTVPPAMVFRMEEKMHICQDSRAGDSNIRRALIDRFANHDIRTGRGTKKAPDWFYGFRKDIWAAYAVAITYIETKLHEEEPS